MADSDNLKNSAYNFKNGRYALGGTTEGSTFALEWWEKKPLAADPSDIVYFLEKKYEFKPDVLGYVFYGDAGLWWVIAQYNTILDPMTELIEGKLLLIPTLDRLRSEFFNPNIATPVVPSTRT